jgi:2-polyprenyl-3-methyl-5-hydroxy-6-metoxy-1,4-benzoquinol methylase
MINARAALAHEPVSEPLLERTEACPLCGGRETSLARTERHNFPADDYFEPYAAVTIELRRCHACDFVFVESLPRDPSFFEHFYTHDRDWQFEFSYHGKGAIARDVKRRILRHVRTGKLLDVGAWSGTLLSALRGQFEVHGVELNPHAARYAREQGFDVRTGAFGSVDLSELAPFDVITFIDVLEHIPQPGRVIDQARELLGPGGLILIKVPHFAAQAAKQTALQRLGLSREGVAQNYAHINHFSPRSLRLALERRGFDVLEVSGAQVEIWNLSAPAPALLRARRRWQNLIRGAVTQTLNGLTRVGLPCALNIQALARRR